MFFWQSLAAVPDQKLKFVLVHMDQKWFYAIRTWTNCKVLTSIGLEPTDYYVQHKSHIGKELCVVATAYVLNEGSNDITRNTHGMCTSWKNGQGKKELIQMSIQR
jgi:hypothetical protein